MRLRFYFDIVCPFAFLAATQVEAVARAAGAQVDWVPILLGGVFRSLGRSQEATAGKSPARVRLDALDLQREAERLKVPLRFPESHPRRTVEAMRLLVAASDAVRPALALALYRAYWVEGLDVSDRAVLARLAEDHGVDPGLLDASEVREGLFATTAEAVERGVFGVPAFVVGDELFWGADRLPLVARALGSEVQRPRPGARGRLTFFHDFSSPYSYLGSTQVEALAGEAELELCPILLGALFREIGTPDVPLFAMGEARRRYAAKDLQDWARYHGVDFRFPSTFPLRTVTALRVALLEPRVTPHVYRAAWVDDRDIGDDAVLASVLGDAGFEGKLLVERTRDPQVKAQLRENTARAVAAGVCGVPSFLVDDRHLFWGQDRLEQVSRALQPEA